MFPPVWRWTVKVVVKMRTSKSRRRVTSDRMTAGTDNPIAICPAQDAERLLGVMRAHPLGKCAALIGEVEADAHHFVRMQTAFGGHRVVDWLSGEQLPRIC